MKAGIDYIGVGVGAVIINDNNEILLTLRGKKAKNEKGTWEIPGGAIEFGETLEAGLIREVKEELDIEIDVLKLIQVCDHLIPTEKQHWVAPSYLCKIVKGKPTIMEPEKCDKIDWFSLEEAQKLKLSIVTKKDIDYLIEYPEVLNF